MEVDATGRVVPVRRNKDGFVVATVHWSQNPDFDYKAACLGMSEEDIRAELEIDWSSGHGLPVYPEFRREIHVARQSLAYNPNEPLHLGWDFGQFPAVAITQIGSFGEWKIFPSFHPDQTEFEGSLYAFAEHVADHLLRTYAVPNGMTLAELPMVHVGDPAGRAATHAVGRNGQETISAFRILAHGMTIDMGEDDNGRRVVQKKPGWGWHLVPGAVSVRERLEAVKARLTTIMKGGIPALVVDPREEFIIGAFLGGYGYRTHSDGTLSRHPDKTIESHVMDGISYVATRLFARPAAKDLDEDETPKWEWESRASGSWRKG